MTTKTKTRLRTVSSAIVSAMTVLTMSGVVYLAPVATNVAQAAVVTSANIHDGNTIRVTGTNDVYIVKLVGAKMFKRLVLNPSIFNSYGQLSWSTVKEVAQSTMDSYTNSNLVQHVNSAGTVVDSKVWSVTSAANSDTGAKKWMNVTAAQFSAAGLDWDSIYKINDLEAADTFYPTGVDVVSTDNLSAWATNVNGASSTTATTTTTTTAAATTGLTVALTGTNPASKVSAKGAQDVVFSTYTVTAGSTGAVKVNSIKVDRGLINDGGIAADTDFTNVKIFHGSVSQANQLDGTLTLNTTTHSITFLNLNWTINAGMSDTLIVTGSVGTGNIIGDVMMLGLRSAASIVLDDTTQTVSGTFPSFGSKVSPANTSVGSATIQMLTSPSANVISGSTGQPLATLRFAPSTEDFNLLSLKFTNAGSALTTDVTNLKLQYGSIVLSTVAAMASNNTVMMSISAPNSENLVKAGTTRDFTLYGDIAGTVNTARTIKMEVMQASDVSAQGVTSGGLVTVTASGTNDCQSNATFPNVGCSLSITQGTLSVALSPAYNPSAQNIVLGASKQIMTALRFSASNDEASNVTQLTVTRTNVLNSADTDLGSIYLARVNTDGTAGSVLATGSLSSGTVQFGTNTINAFDSTYLFQVPKGSYYDVYILADIPTSATAAHQFHLDVTASSQVKADGVSSQNDLPSASITGSATGNTMTLAASGSMTISASSSTAATTYVKGSTADEFGRLTFTAGTGEDLTLSSMKLTFSSNSNSSTALTTANTPTNVKVYKTSVVSANLLGTVASPSSGVANFSFTDTVKSGVQTTYIIVGDLPTTNGASTIYVGIANPNTDVTVSGVSSGASTTTIINSTTNVTGNAMTVGVGQLGVIMSSLPVYTNITSKTNGAEVARMVLSSNVNGETVRVSSIKVTLAGAANHATNKSIDSAALSNVTLYDISGGDVAGTGVKTSVVGTLTSNAATFSGLQIDIPSGTQRVIGVKVNVGSPADTAPVNIVMGVNSYYSDVVASGLSSASTIYANQLMKSGIPVVTIAAVGATATSLHNLIDVSGGSGIDLSAAGVPALGISAIGVGDIVGIAGQDFVTTTASNSTVVEGWNGTATTALATALPVQLKVGGLTISTSGNNLSTNSTTSIVSATTVAGSFRTGELLSQYDVSVGISSSSDLSLITVIAAGGLTTTIRDAYAGTTFSRDTGNDQYLVPMTNFGQAQVVQSVGTLTLAADSATPLAKQVVAGTSDVEFSRFNLTAQYEKIDVTMLKFTRTGGTQTADSLGGGADTDFASVYLQNLTNSTWGPNGNGKSATVQLVSGVATFNFAASNAIVVDPSSSTGTSFAIKGNLNTVAAGAGSGDAPKFYIAALNTTNLTANGDATGTVLSSFTAGTPTAATATNFNAQSIYKGLLSVALNSASLSGNQTRSANQAFLQLDMSSNASGSVATFRQGVFNTADTSTTALSGALTTATTWAVANGSTCTGTAAVLANDSTNYIDGTASQQMTGCTNTASAGDGMTATFGSNINLSGYAGMAFWVRSSQTAQTFDATLTGGTGTRSVTVTAVNSWQLVDVPFSTADTPFTSLTSVSAFKIISHAALANSATLNVDRLIFYKDKVVVSLASNSGLFATTGATNTAVTLQQGSTVLATGYYSGTTSAGSVTFVPASQFTIPTTGSTLAVVADTTVLMTGAKTLASTISLGSADNGGSTTAGNIWWHDGSFALTNNDIRWIYGTVSSISSGTITFQ